MRYTILLINIASISGVNQGPTAQNPTVEELGSILVFKSEHRYEV